MGCNHVDWINMAKDTGSMRAAVNCPPGPIKEGGIFLWDSSSIGTTAHCGLWPVEHCPSIFSYLPPTFSTFSLPALEDLFLLPLSIFSWVFPFFSSLPFLE